MRVRWGVEDERWRSQAVALVMRHTGGTDSRMTLSRQAPKPSKVSRKELVPRREDADGNAEAGFRREDEALQQRVAPVPTYRRGDEDEDQDQDHELSSEVRAHAAAVGRSGLLH